MDMSMIVEIPRRVVTVRVLGRILSVLLSRRLILGARSIGVLFCARPGNPPGRVLSRGFVIDSDNDRQTEVVTR